MSPETLSQLFNGLSVNSRGARSRIFAVLRMAMGDVKAMDPYAAELGFARPHLLRAVAYGNALRQDFDPYSAYRRATATRTLQPLADLLNVSMDLLMPLMVGAAGNRTGLLELFTHLINRGVTKPEVAEENRMVIDALGALGLHTPSVLDQPMRKNGPTRFDVLCQRVLPGKPSATGTDDSDEARSCLQALVRIMLHDLSSGANKHYAVLSKRLKLWRLTNADGRPLDHDAALVRMVLAMASGSPSKIHGNVTETALSRLFPDMAKLSEQPVLTHRDLQNLIMALVPTVPLRTRKVAITAFFHALYDRGCNMEPGRRARAKVGLAYLRSAIQGAVPIFDDATKSMYGLLGFTQPNVQYLLHLLTHRQFSQLSATSAAGLDPASVLLETAEQAKAEGFTDTSAAALRASLTAFITVSASVSTAMRDPDIAVLQGDVAKTTALLQMLIPDSLGAELAHVREMLLRWMTVASRPSASNLSGLFNFVLAKMAGSSAELKVFGVLLEFNKLVAAAHDEALHAASELLELDAGSMATLVQLGLTPVHVVQRLRPPLLANGLLDAVRELWGNKAQVPDLTNRLVLQMETVYSQQGITEQGSPLLRVFVKATYVYATTFLEHLANVKSAELRQQRDAVLLRHEIQVALFSTIDKYPGAALQLAAKLGQLFGMSQQLVSGIISMARTHLSSATISQLAPLLFGQTQDSQALSDTLQGLIGLARGDVLAIKPLAMKFGSFEDRVVNDIINYIRAFQNSSISDVRDTLRTTLTEKLQGMGTEEMTPAKLFVRFGIKQSGLMAFDEFYVRMK